MIPNSPHPKQHEKLFNNSCISIFESLENSLLINHIIALNKYAFWSWLGKYTV
jgi:hypothetical protein